MKLWLCCPTVRMASAATLESPAARWTPSSESKEVTEEEKKEGFCNFIHRSLQLLD